MPFLVGMTIRLAASWVFGPLAFAALVPYTLGRSLGSEPSFTAAHGALFPFGRVLAAYTALWALAAIACVRRRVRARTAAEAAVDPVSRLAAGAVVAGTLAAVPYLAVHGVAAVDVAVLGVTFLFVVPPSILVSMAFFA